MAEPLIFGGAYLTGCLVCAAIAWCAVRISDRWEAWRG